MTKYAGIFIASHKVCDAASKDTAQETFSGWKLESYTAENWMKKLEAGQTIQPSAFSPKNDGTFTHALKFWNSTHFVCADADNIKGVEFLDDGTDKNPSGVEYWTEHDGLSKRFSLLKDRAYAVGQSVSSMAKEPLHRRYRLIFLFDAPITSEKHYHQILLALAAEFPIIPAVERSPAQPVFGNARDGFGFHICGNVLSLSDFPYTPPAESKDKSQPRLEFDETLEEYLKRHGIAYTPSDEVGKYYVTCPFKDHHTGGINKPKDAYVFDDGKGWAFYCSHASCEKHRTWDAFKRGNGIANGSGSTPKRNNDAKPESVDFVKDKPAPRDMLSALPPDEHSTPEFPNYDGELFIGAFQNLYLAYADTHVWSPEMIMAFGIGSLSYVAGRHVTVQTHEDTKPEPLNFYILAVGESDLTAKSEAVRELKKHITHCDDDFAPISNAQSLEGILKALGENDQASQYVMLDESSVVFTNSRREGTKNILGGLNELWVCPKNYTTVRAGEKARVDDPYLNCWGNIPTELIPSVFRQEDLVAGTLNRWLPFYITPKTKTERSPHAGSDYYDMWIKRLKSVYSSYGSDRHLIFTTEADDARFQWYDTLRQNAIKGGTQTGESRFHTHAVKLSGLFALADNPIDNDTVTIEHWETALGVIRYLFQCYEYLFRNVGSTRLGDIENKILDMLNRSGNEMTLTELGRKVRGTDSTERERVIEALEKHGVVIRFREETNGRYTTKIRRVG